MNWHERYRAMKSALKLTNADIAEITGNSADSVKSVTQPNKDLPRWLKLAIVVYESGELFDNSNQMFENMQYYMEHCQRHGYCTPHEWIIKHKHF